MPIISHEDILGFEVTVDNAKHVKVFQRKKNLCYIKPTCEKPKVHLRNQQHLSTKLIKGKHVGKCIDQETLTGKKISAQNKIKITPWKKLIRKYPAISNRAR